jgi:hypothetical protein
MTFTKSWNFVTQFYRSLFIIHEYLVTKKEKLIAYVTYLLNTDSEFQETS